MYNEFLTNKEHHTCYGCRACEQACSTGAIQMKSNDEGFLYPVLDESLCVKCGLCEKVCPYSKEDLNGDEQQVFAAKHKSNETLMRSSSGGVFSALADFVLSKGGYVAGCVFDRDLKACHIISKDVKEIARMRGSKYVQSDMGDSYKKVKELLGKGLWVLFTGTPCQVAGLKSFLGKNYETLITADLICHGVPSPELFQQAVGFYEKSDNGKVLSLSFRDKKYGGWSTCGEIKIQKKNKILIKHNTPFNDYYYQYFIVKNSVYRMSCYSCKYATQNRVADITIGDFWNIADVFPDFDFKNGASVIILNTEAGKRVFSEIKENFIYRESDIETAKKGNGNLCHPSALPESRKTVYKRINEIGFAAAAKQDCKIRRFVPALKRMIPKDLKQTIKKFLKK